MQSIAPLNFKKNQLALAVSVVIAGNAVSTAMAQDAPEGQGLEEVTVTGSRIVRRDLTAASPIMTMDRSSFEESSTVGLESVLNQMPQFVAAGDQFTSGIESGATTTPGSATLNLRGLGTNRNLVLIDGRRAQPANASLAVDINTIPASAIANVEVITGGASAVYGPDAMAGVVNFTLRDDFEGIEFDIQTGATGDGDGEESRFSALFGTNSADGRGNVMVGLDWTKRNAVYQIDRDWYTNGWNDPGTVGGGFLNPWTYAGNQAIAGGGTNPPSQAAVDQLFSRYGVPAGTLTPSSVFAFNPDGTVFTDVQGYGYNGPLNCWEGCGTFTGVRRLANGDLDQQFTQAYLSIPLERHSLFMSGTYDISDKVRAFARANYVDTDVHTRGGIPPAITVWQAYVPRDGRALPDDLNTLLDSRNDPGGDWSLYDVMAYNGPIEPINNNSVWQLLVGLEGDIGDGDTTWEVYYSRGDTRIEKVNTHIPSLQRYSALLAAPNFGQGSVTAPRNYVLNCESGLPIFDDFTPTQDCLDGIDMKMVDTSHLTQEITEVNVQGHLVDNWAGDVRYALGASYRKNSFQYQPGNPASAIVEHPIGLFSSNATGGDVDVSELYGELLLPLAESFDFELGYRYSDFSTAGGYDTYKGLFTWQSTDTITLRGGYQKATRAANVAELFGAPTLNVVFFPGEEPCSSTTQATWGNVPSNPDRQQVQDLCRAIIGNNTSEFDTQDFSIFRDANGNVITGPDGWHRRIPPYFPLAIEVQEGNPNVQPETGKTYTFGAIFNGTVVDNLTVAVDYYQIEIEGAIAPLSVSTIYDNCFNRYGTNPTYDISNEFCQLITRNPVTGDRAQVAALYSNLGVLKTAGVDIQVNWTKDVGPGAFGINSTINYLDSFEYQPSPQSNIIDAKGTMDDPTGSGTGGLFDYQAYTRFSFSRNNYSVGLTWRYLSGIEDAAYALNPNTPNRPASAYSNFGLTGRVSFNRYDVRFGVDNLFDVDPENIGGVNPGVDNNATSTVAGTYDVLGRRFYAGLTVSF